MSKLYEALGHWPVLTPDERNALVAEHVMGWHRLRGTGAYWWSNKPERKESNWNPTTDRNGCAEAVRTFGKDFRWKAEWVHFSKMLWMLPALSDARDVIHDQSGTQYNIVDDEELGDTQLLDPSDVCHAMLQALAESEADDD